ncbi:MAG TPA: hypothetical protein VJZ51_04715 [Bacilli bacterium]|nr:hypothetical protein [Bacilli bacterium]
MRAKVKVVETYHVDSDSEVNALIEESKTDRSFQLTGHKSKIKNIKQKGEIVDSYFIVELTKSYED